jgi:hypothetical protein
LGSIVVVPIGDGGHFSPRPPRSARVSGAGMLRGTPPARLAASRLPHAAPPRCCSARAVAALAPAAAAPLRRRAALCARPRAVRHAQRTRAAAPDGGSSSSGSDDAVLRTRTGDTAAERLQASTAQARSAAAAAAHTARTRCYEAGRAPPTTLLGVMGARMTRGAHGIANPTAAHRG